MKKKKQESKMIRHLWMTTDEDQKLKKAVDIIISRDDGYGNITATSFSRSVVLREVNKILKEGK